VSDLQQFLSVGEHAARSGGEVLLDWMGRFKVHEKGPADLVTEADVASQEAVRSVLLGAFPDHGMLSEENLSTPPSPEGYRWIVDPLDGTTNYVHAIPHFAVSIALEQRGQLIAGVIYDPIDNECFSAVVGGGATLNGRKLQVSKVTDVDQAVAAMSFPPRIDRHAAELKEFATITVLAQSMRRMGSSAWDVAAGVLLVTEAGGIVTSRTGGPFRLDDPNLMAASTPQLHAQLQRMLSGGSADGK
jgi:myo-inositol-1(or 4)-monophosphatase